MVLLWTTEMIPASYRSLIQRMKACKFSRLY